MDIQKLRNIAIIAHVDHGKTTLVDNLLKQAHVFKDYQAEMSQTTILDKNELERERGVTILAKNTAITYKDFKINILDTPGHADFSGEVERVLTMADGCILLVDAAEGVLSQTRYVLKLALELGLVPIVVINKVDRKDQRNDEVQEEINNLFLELATTTEQLDFKTMYAIGKEGIAGFVVESNPDNSLKITDSNNLTPLFEEIINTIPSPKGSLEGGFQLQITTLDYDDYKGRYVIGKISRGTVKKADSLAIVRDGKKVAQSRVEYLYTHYGLERKEVEEAQVGDIVALTGFPDTKIGDTLASLDNPESLSALPITEPTMKMQISVSTSPFVGQDGEFTTSRQLRQRLEKELETNVSLRLEPGLTGESFIVSGRGELHLSILIETMRREGYEFSVSRPEVIYKQIEGQTAEPYEMVTIEVPEEYSGVIINEMGRRKGQMVNMHNIKNNIRFDYKISTRNLIGFRNQILTQTSGTAVINSMFIGYEPKGEDIPLLRNGVIISGATGPALTYALSKAQERGITFVDPGSPVYNGMIVGLNSRKDDMVMNICKGKKLTNMRSSTKDNAIQLAPPVKMSLEQCLTFIGPDELLEVTPKNLRLRKKDLASYLLRF
jgi:GTP-binding protein